MVVHTEMNGGAIMLNKHGIDRLLLVVKIAVLAIEAYLISR
jgi:hypothetical protein